MLLSRNVAVVGRDGVTHLGASVLQLADRLAERTGIGVAQCHSVRNQRLGDVVMPPRIRDTDATLPCGCFNLGTRNDMARPQRLQRIAFVLRNKPAARLSRNAISGQVEECHIPAPPSYVSSKNTPPLRTARMYRMTCSRMANQSSAVSTSSIFTNPR